MIDFFKGLAKLTLTFFYDIGGIPFGIAGFGSDRDAPRGKEYRDIRKLFHGEEDEE